MKNKKNNKSKLTFKTPFIRFMFKVLCWMVKVFTTFSGSEPRYATSHMEFVPLLTKLDLVLKTRGPIGLINYVKPVRVQLLTYLSGKKVRAKGIRTTSDGIPKCLGDLIAKIRRSGSPEIIEKSILPFLSTILWSTRSLKPSVIDDISTVIVPPRRDTAEEITIGKYLNDFWQTLGYRKSKTVPKRLRFRSYHFTTKSGPNGHALGHYLDDLEGLPPSLESSIHVVGGEILAERMKVLRRNSKALRANGHLPDLKRERLVRKLISFPDMEGKKRVVAELDYFSQTCLKPLHHWLFRLLKRIPQDRTFNQGGFVNTFDDCNEEIYSIDLTAATDRFPITFIEKVLSGVLPDEYVRSWRDIMIGYPFKFQKRDVYYAAGNPMGAYSSWASFTVAHHYLVYYCCRELGLDWKKYKYHLLGDDIVISSSQVGELYMNLLTKLGVEYSPLKTHKSKILFEFAKRYFYKGEDSRFWEISPFPISALKETSRRSYLLTYLLRSVRNSGWVVSSIPYAVSEYYRIVKHHSARNCKKMLNDSVLCEQIMNIISGSSVASDGISTLTRYFGLHIEPSDSEKFLSTIAKNLFTESDPRGRESFDLGDLAFNLVIYLTTPGNTGQDTADSVIQAEPILFCYGKVEEWYLDLLRNAKRIEEVNENWPLILRSFALPSDDNIFTKRAVETRFLAAYLIGKKILEGLRNPKSFPELEWLRVTEYSGDGFTMWDRAPIRTW